jgi:hypothetical protein
LTWRNKEVASGFKFRAAAFGAGTFVVVGTPLDPVQKNSMIMTSTDGDSWTLRSVGPLYYFRGIAYGRDTFVAVGNAILQSDPL